MANQRRNIEVKEKEGLVEFPLLIIDIPEQANTPTHRHKFHELVIIRSGAGTHVVEGMEYPVCRGDVYLLSDERAHGYINGDKLQLTNILFQPERLAFPHWDLRKMPGYHVLFSLEPQYRQRHTFKSRLRLNDEQLGQALAMIDELIDELARRGPGYQVVSVALFMKLIAHLSRAYVEDDRPQTQALLRIGRAISHLETNFDAPITVDDLAKISHMSRRNFQRAFNQAVGQTPIQYLINIRMERAKFYLRDEDLSVADVAEACGYSRPSYFIRHFRAAVGVTPLQFRRKQ